MSILVKRLTTPALLSDSTTTKYTCPAQTVTKDIEMHFCNTDGSNTIGVTVYLVPSGSTAGASNTFISQTGAGAFKLTPGQSRAWGTEQVLQVGDTIQAKADTTSKIAMFISGKEVSQG